MLKEFKICNKTDKQIHNRLMQRGIRMLILVIKLMELIMLIISLSRIILGVSNRSIMRMLIQVSIPITIVLVTNKILIEMKIFCVLS